MTPNEFQTACLRTWHQTDDTRVLEHRDALEVQSALEHLGWKSLDLERVKKEVFMRRSVEWQQDNYTQVRVEAHDRRAEARTPEGFRRLHALVGLGGEWQELMRAKTHEERLNEAGDVLYYHAVWCHEHGLSLADVMVANVEKLKARYPDAGAPCQPEN